MIYHFGGQRFRMTGGNADDTNGGETAAERAAADRPSGTAPSLEAALRTATAATPAAGRTSLEGADRADRPDRPEHVSSVLVAVAGGPHSGAVVDVAERVADATDAWLELFHSVPSDALDPETGDSVVGSVDVDADRPDADFTDDTESVDTDHVVAGTRLLAAACDRLDALDCVDCWLVEADAAADAIVEQSPYYDLVVVGAATTGTVGRFVFGSTTDAIVDGAATPVIVVEADGSAPLR